MLSYAMTYHHAVDPFLRDETQIYLRRIRSTDKQKLLEHFKGLSPSSSYNRFFCVRKEWSKQELKRFTEPNLVRHVALVATIGNGPQEKIVGDGRYVIEGSESIAELALFVLDAYQNRGIGTLLLVHLVQRARCAGAIRLYGNVLAANHKTIWFLLKRGFRPRYPSESGVIRLSLATASVDSGPLKLPGMQPSVEEIRRRAYELFLARSEGSGSQMEDWLDAERDLRARISI